MTIENGEVSTEDQIKKLEAEIKNKKELIGATNRAGGILEVIERLEAELNTKKVELAKLQEKQG